jgi:Putative peptidoglycan binding domain/Protein of unknown function (DUF3238)
MSEPTLMRGDSGEAVARLQQLLFDAGYDPGTVDGFFGYQTAAAVRDLQRASGLVVDGVVGPATWRVLLGLPDPGGEAPPPRALGSIKVWINAFIPRDVPDLTRLSPSGDGTVVPGPVPLEVFQWHNCDPTVEIDCEDGTVECEQRGDTSRMQFSNLRGFDGSLVQVDVVAAANNPCVTGSPDIDYQGTVTIDTTRRLVEFDGVIDAFPAFEMYASADNGPAAAVFRTMPLPGKDPWNLPGDAERFQSGSAELPT